MTTTRRNAAAADDYLKLVRRFPLRPIRTQAEYERAVEVLLEVGERADAGCASPGESDYADVLSHLVRGYDQQHSI